MSKSVNQLYVSVHAYQIWCMHAPINFALIICWEVALAWIQTHAIMMHVVVLCWCAWSWSVSSQRSSGFNLLCPSGGSVWHPQSKSCVLQLKAFSNQWQQPGQEMNYTAFYIVLYTLPWINLVPLFCCHWGLLINLLKSVWEVRANLGIFFKE